MAMILITHDLGIIAETADEVLVMYAGKVVEQGSVAEIFGEPLHPYTRGLLNSVPVFKPVSATSGERDSSQQKKKLDTIPGIVPSLLELPKGCRFQTRCTFATEECKTAEPELRSVRGDSHRAACIKDLAPWQRR